MKTLLTVVCGSVLVLGLVGCDLEGLAGMARVEEEFHESHAMEPGGRISVESLNGAVEIQGWDQDEVDISGRKYAASQEMLDALDVDIVASDDSVRIRVIEPSGRRGNRGASFTIRVPREIEIELVETSNGRVRMEDVDGNARLRTSNGGVRISNVTGDIEARSSNGPIELAQYSGSANLRTSNGAITAEGIRGYLEAETSNGSINARVEDLDSGRPLRLRSSNGSLTLTLDEVPTTDIIATTSNASITVRAPAELAARLQADTSNASVSSDFDVTEEAGSNRKNRLIGTIAGGGSLIDLDTSNASIRLERVSGG